MALETVGAPREAHDESIAVFELCWLTSQVVDFSGRSRERQVGRYFKSVGRKGLGSNVASY